MQTLMLDEYCFNFYSDLSGDVLITKCGGETMTVPGSVLKEVVAEYVRAERIARLEQMGADELLGV